MQPWAQLIAAGLKSVETRGRSTNVRGRIAIHAGAQLAPQYAPRGVHHHTVLSVVSDGCGRMTLVGPHGPLRDGSGCTILPVGAIVATADLWDVVPIIDHTECGTRLDAPPHVCTAPPDGLYLHHPIRGPLSEATSETPLHHERDLGDYTPGRWAWLLRDVEPLPEPVPFVGGQLWSRTWDGTR